MLHEPCRTVGRQSTLLHAVQHGGVSCMGITNPPLALSGHARQFRAETLCSAKRGKGKGVRGALPHGGWDRVLDGGSVASVGPAPWSYFNEPLIAMLPRVSCVYWGFHSWWCSRQRHGLHGPLNLAISPERMMHGCHSPPPGMPNPGMSVCVPIFANCPATGVIHSNSVHAFGCS